MRTEKFDKQVRKHRSSQHVRTIQRRREDVGLKKLDQAGCNDLMTYRNDDLPFGIAWPAGHSAPIAACVSVRMR
ncbi:hypothetical protein [Caballeronia sp. LZ035]|uniref:hypothetical protein n=1 Tax=Caballeronia sp. LZ035 TaxID=3038568 RepID=UPI002865F1B4|nr:hypothetical protein [Caballeronia sp. LZ035]MDR5762252.1 hypothetical protein [Caballeronia sp. LZ035]